MQVSRAERTRLIRRRSFSSAGGTGVGGVSVVHVLLAGQEKGGFEATKILRASRLRVLSAATRCLSVCVRLKARASSVA